MIKNILNRLIANFIITPLKRTSKGVVGWCKNNILQHNLEILIDSP